MKRNMLIFCAHSDDVEISMGGTLAKYVREGYNFVVIIFSYGELSHLKKEIIIKRRIRESRNAGRILGYNDIKFFGLPDGHIASEIKYRKIKERVKNLIREYDPIKIFTHSPSDPMPDHRTVNNVVFEALKENNKKYDLYCFDVWNISNFREKNRPKMIVDISDTFKLKISSLREYKSQMHVMFQLIPAVFLRAKWFGIKNNCKYAERFYKLQ